MNRPVAFPRTEHLRADWLSAPSKLATARLCLRRIEEGDGPPLFRLIADNRTRFVADFPRSVGYVTDPDRAELLARGRQAQWLNQETFAFLIWHAETAVGWCTLKHVESGASSSAEFEYALDSRAEGRGYMQEAAAAVMSFGLESLALTFLTARVALHNQRSRQLLLRLGFRYQEDLLDANQRLLQRFRFQPG